MEKISYYEVCVNTARMIGNPKVTKNQLERYATRFFEYAGKSKEFDPAAFSAAYSEFRKANGAKLFQPIYV